MLIFSGRKVRKPAPARTWDGVAPWKRENAFAKLSGVSYPYRSAMSTTRSSVCFRSSAAWYSLRLRTYSAIP